MRLSGRDGQEQDVVRNTAPNDRQLCGLAIKVLIATEK
jgi:hypothetical protein